MRGTRVTKRLAVAPQPPSEGILNEKDEDRWYRQRGYAHFDRRPSRETAIAKAKDATKVARHSFFPFIMRPVRVVHRKTESVAGHERRTWVEKVRPVAYAAHMDTHIHAYYGSKIVGLLESVYAGSPFSDGILAYRALRKCNIDFALSAFDEIRARRNVDVLAVDVEGFFDCLDHNHLKTSWSALLGEGRLPADHWAVYRSVTADHVVRWPDIRRVLGEKYRRYCGTRGEPVCSLNDFRTKLVPLILPRHQAIWDVKKKSRPTWLSTGPTGIPQGSALSAALANLYMLSTDRRLFEELSSMGASYRRYSDDILVIAPAGRMEEALRCVGSALNDVGLRMNNGKTERAYFRSVACAGTPRIERGPAGKGESAMRYLGLTFDGSSVSLRDASIARFVIRMNHAVERGRIAAEVRGESKIKRRKIFATMSSLGPGQAYGKWIRGKDGRFWPKDAPRLGFPAYALRAAQKAESAGIRKQRRKLLSRLQRVLRQKSDKLE